MTATTTTTQPFEIGTRFTRTITDNAVFIVTAIEDAPALGGAADAFITFKNARDERGTTEMMRASQLLATATLDPNPVPTPARDTTSQKITVNGREYTIERTGFERTPYTLTGKRGAYFMLNRAINAPDMLFGLNFRGNDPLNGTRLTDIDGTLREMTWADWQGFKAAGRVR